MNKNELFNAIGQISDELITEVEAPVKARRIRPAKMGLIAAAAAAVLGVTALAANMVIVGISGHSYSKADYNSVPSQEILAKDVGISPAIIDTFDTGFEFSGARIVENQAYDEKHSVVKTFKSIGCDYGRDDKEIGLYIEPIEAALEDEGMEKIETYNGIVLEYMSYTNKLVPGNYEMTEQDKEDQASGKYVFSFGNPEGITISQVQGLAWQQDGLRFDFIDIGGNASKDELIAMAKELIDAQ